MLYSIFSISFSQEEPFASHKFESWITGVCSPNVVSLCDFADHVGKSLQLLCILDFDMLCLSVISMMFVYILFAVCMLVGMVV